MTELKRTALIYDFDGTLARGQVHELGDLLIGTAHAQAAPPAAAPGKAAPLRPYDEELYNLAFEVFLGNSNLKDAYRVAEAAVAQRPGDLR